MAILQPKLCETIITISDWHHSNHRHWLMVVEGHPESGGPLQPLKRTTRLMPNTRWSKCTTSGTFFREVSRKSLSEKFFSFFSFFFLHREREYVAF